MEKIKLICPAYRWFIACRWYGFNITLPEEHRWCDIENSGSKRKSTRHSVP